MALCRASLGSGFAEIYW